MAFLYAYAFCGLAFTFVMVNRLSEPEFPLIFESTFTFSKLILAILMGATWPFWLLVRVFDNLFS